MTYFLERIAKLLYDQTRGDLRNDCLVFPSRRAGLYFLKYLAGQIDRPVWTPAIMTINEFFGSLSDLQIAENELLLCEMYKVYRKLNESAESFDDFYFWGDMLINDFDDVDKYMTDTSVLFRNVREFRDIDILFGDIDPEMADIIKQFWKNFEPEKPSYEKSEFKSVWSILNELYSEFRISLRTKNLAYEGMIFRDVAAKALSDETFEIKWERIHFIGFNALNKCEETVMKRLRAEGKAKFYWDYDISYIKGGKLNSAGLFMSRNLNLFGNDMPEDWNYNTFLSVPAEETSIRIIETTSDVAQVKVIPQLISQIPGITPEHAHHTAVILADEGLLVPVLTSLPENIGDINISMGYPLKMTGVYALVKHIMNLQRNSTIENGTVFFNYREVIDVLRHRLTGFLLNENDSDILNEITEKNLVRIPQNYLCRSENLRKIFRKDSDPAQLSNHLRDILVSVSTSYAGKESSTKELRMETNMRNEFIYRVLLTINRLETIISTSDLSFKTETYIRILDKILRNQSVPFSGEPLSGIQIMGILETRALDFENIIFLSVNEGILPATTSVSSFIPFSIRQAFGLPTINHQESIFAYHFFRLLHRATNVTLVYNSNSDGLRSGEMSRFITQMKYEQIIKPVILNLNFDIRSPATIGEMVERNDQHSARLYSLYLENGGRSVLSPTAVNTWLNCRMRFYYRYVNGLKESQTITGQFDHSVFGLILHRLMKNIYENLPDREVSKEILESLIRNEQYLRILINKAYHEEESPGIERIPDGNELIIKDILHMYLVKILKADKSFAPFRILNLEKLFIFRLSYQIKDKVETVKTGGNVDRVDSKSGITRVVDYKTGSTARKINSVEDLFLDDRRRELDGWLQTLLYCEAFLAENPDLRVRPSIYKIKELPGEDFSDTLRIKAEQNQDLLLEDYQKVRDEFLTGLRNTIATIFNPDEPFIMTANTQKCGYCPFRGLCQR